MSTENSSDPAMRSSQPFDRFDAAMKAIFSVSKPAVVAEEKRQQNQRKAERSARKERRSA